MKVKYIVDANILLRIITQEPEDMVQVAAQLIDQVENGIMIFVVPSMVVAEEPFVLEALKDFSGKNVDFVDAYLAQKAIAAQNAVITWNKKHFKKLNCEYYLPKELLD